MGSNPIWLLSIFAVSEMNLPSIGTKEKNMTNKDYSIKKIPRNNQDKRMEWCRYRVKMSNGTTFECIRYDSWPKHIYFRTNTQFTVDGDVLDSIEKDILSHDLVSRISLLTQNIFKEGGSNM